MTTFGSTYTTTSTSSVPMMSSYSSTTTMSNTNTAELENGLQEALGNMRQVEIKAIDALKNRDAQQRQALEEKDIVIMELQKQIQSVAVERTQNASTHERLQSELVRLTRLNRDLTATADGAKEENARLMRRLTALEDGERHAQAAAEVAQKQTAETRISVQRALQELVEERAKFSQLEAENRTLFAKLKYSATEMEVIQKKFDMQNEELMRLRQGESSQTNLMRSKDDELRRLREEFQRFQIDAHRDNELLRMYSNTHHELNRRLTDVSAVELSN